MGHDLWKEAQDNFQTVCVQSVIIWYNVHKHGRRIIGRLLDDFKTLEVVEQYSDYFKLKVPKVEGKSIGFLFGLVEDMKPEYNISEYSVQ